jgi:hypothetical protein
MPRIAPADMAEEELAQALEYINEAKEDRPLPFWDAFAACIEAYQKRREALLDWRMERMDS